jgi:hypothetical protein
MLTYPKVLEPSPAPSFALVRDTSANTIPSLPKKLLYSNLLYTLLVLCNIFLKWKLFR